MVGFLLKCSLAELLSQVIPFKEAHCTCLRQEWNSDFGLDKDRKKDSWQGDNFNKKRKFEKKDPGSRMRECLSRQNSTKKCVNLRKKIQVRQKKP